MKHYSLSITVEFLKAFLITYQLHKHISGGDLGECVFR